MLRYWTRARERRRCCRWSAPSTGARAPTLTVQRRHRTSDNHHPSDASPQVCEQLHRFIVKAYPEEYGQREKEAAGGHTSCRAKATRMMSASTVPSRDVPLSASCALCSHRFYHSNTAAEEEEDGVASPSIILVPQSQPAASAADDFQCPACRKLLLEPLVLSCGHALCATCAPQPGGSSAGAPAAASPAAGTSSAAASSLPSAAQQQPGSEAKPEGRASAASSGSALVCPCCAEPVLPGARVCAMIDEAVQQLLPEQHKRRREDVAIAAAAQPHQQRDGGAGGASAAPGSAAAVGNPTQTRGGSGAGAGEAAAPSGSGASSGQHRSKLPGMEEIVRSSGGDVAELWRRLKQELRDKADLSYSWYGVGCDGCGVYPIVGRRYRCQDCPEQVRRARDQLLFAFSRARALALTPLFPTVGIFFLTLFLLLAIKSQSWNTLKFCFQIGYDLCGACHDRGLAGQGRFNQAHRTHHRLTKCTPELDFGLVIDVDAGGSGSALHGFMNCLEALHPELPVERALALAMSQVAVTRAAAGGEGGEGGGQAAAGDEGGAEPGS